LPHRRRGRRADPLLSTLQREPLYSVIGATIAGAARRLALGTEFH
jgi:hypothetical protein